MAAQSSAPMFAPSATLAASSTATPSAAPPSAAPTASTTPTATGPPSGITTTPPTAASTKPPSVAAANANAVTVAPKPVSTNTSSCLDFELKADKWDWPLKLTARIVAIGLLITAVSFGASRLVFNLNTRNLFGRDVDVELQLAPLGLVNKIMDLLVTISLEDLAGVALTLLLVGKAGVLGKSGSGIRLLDFELGQELTKPWVSISSFQKRCSSEGFNWTSFGRLMLALVTSICVLLQGLAINTIGMPKERWYSQRTQVYPFVELRGIDTSFGTIGSQIIGDFSSESAAAMYSASVAFSRLPDLRQVFTYNERGWQRVGGSDTDAQLVVLNTVIQDEGPVRGVAIKADLMTHIFQWIHDHGAAPAGDSVGWSGHLDLISPLITTNCVNSEVMTSDRTTVVVSQKDNTSTNFQIAVPTPTDDPAGGAGVECSMSLDIVLFPVAFWKIKDLSTSSVSVDGYGKAFNASVKPLPPSPINAVLASKLATQLGIIFEIYERLTPNLTSAAILNGNAVQIRAARPDISHQEDALAAVLTTMAVALLGSAAWDVSLSSDQDKTLDATELLWQVYGSGPQLAWQWITVLVLSVLMLSLLAAITQSLIHRVSPAELLRPAGMLVVANQSDDLTSLGTGTAKGTAPRYWLDADSSSR